MISEVFCTQDRDRTGTPKNWCLRPARLPIPPPGLDVDFKRDVCFKLVCKYRNFFQCSKAFEDFFLKIKFQTIVGKVYSGRKLLIFNVMQPQVMADVG